MLFITDIFPNGVNGLVCHLGMSVLIFCNTLAKLISGTASISVEKLIPKRLNSDLPQSKHSVTLSLFPKISMVFKADWSEDNWSEGMGLGLVVPILLIPDTYCCRCLTK